MAQASDKEREIHALILAKDDLAFARLCDGYYEAVFSKVKQFNRGIHAIDDTLIADVVTDSFLHYFRQPQRYDPEKQSLEYFLVMDAEGDLKNALQKLKRSGKKFPKAVELPEEDGNSLLDELSFTPFDALVQKEAGATLEKTLNTLFEKEQDVQLAQLMLAGERRTEEYARVLGIGHLPEEAQRGEVKKHKDRIDKVIRRKLRGEGNHG